MEFMEKWNVAKSRTTPWNPAGNGQCERFNGIIWKTVELRLRENEKPIEQWEGEVAKALANIRELPSRAIGGETPHLRLLSFNRRSPFVGVEADMSRPRFDPNLLPDWMAPGRRVLLKRHPRERKSDPIADEVRMVRPLSEHHALVSFGNRIDTVSTKYLSRLPPDAGSKSVEEAEPTVTEPVEIGETEQPVSVARPLSVSTEAGEDELIRRPASNEVPKSPTARAGIGRPASSEVLKSPTTRTGIGRPANNESPKSPASSGVPKVVTRSGRVSRRPSRFADFW